MKSVSLALSLSPCLYSQRLGPNLEVSAGSSGRFFRGLEARRKTLPEVFVMSHHWQNVLASIVGVVAQSGDAADSFATRFVIKDLEVVRPTPHHATLLSCGCSRCDVEDVELWASWIATGFLFFWWTL